MHCVNDFRLICLCFIAIKHKGVSTLAAKAGDNVELGISGVDANLLMYVVYNYLYCSNALY